MTETKYTPIYTEPAYDENAALRDRCRDPWVTRMKLILVTLTIALLVSLSANITFVHRIYVEPWRTYDVLPSRYAHLHRNYPIEIVPHNDFDSLNRTVQDAAWNHPDLMEWDTVVALDENYVRAQGLLHAQRWPWDHDKGIYILSGGHNLHCVNILRSWINEDQDGFAHEDRTWTYPHVLHCLNTVREVVMCDADDTPLYTGRFFKNIPLEEPKAGTGVVKMCRNWTQMMEWARERSACYRYVKDEERIDNYKYCPDGSKPWEEEQST